MRRWWSGQSQQTVNLSAYAFAGSNPARRTFVENTLRGILFCKSAPGASKQFCLRLDSKDTAMSVDERVGVEST